MGQEKTVSALTVLYQTTEAEGIFLETQYLGFGNTILYHGQCITNMMWLTCLNCISQNCPKKYFSCSFKDDSQVLIIKAQNYSNAIIITLSCFNKRSPLQKYRHQHQKLAFIKSDVLIHLTLRLNQKTSLFMLWWKHSNLFLAKIYFHQTKHKSIRIQQNTQYFVKKRPSMSISPLSISCRFTSYYTCVQRFKVEMKVVLCIFQPLSALSAECQHQPCTPLHHKTAQYGRLRYFRYS